MPEILNVTTSAPGTHLMDFSVEVSGMTVTVSAGSMLYKGTEYHLTEDEAYTIPARRVDTDVMAYIVLDHSQDEPELRVFVDETVLDGVDIPHAFTRGGDVELVAYLYQIVVPAGTTDLADLDLVRWQIKEQK